MDIIITRYLAAGKRLVVPEFGAFIRREAGGEVLFVEFLKKDDGVLAGLVMSEYALGEGEARDMIAGFVATVREAVDRGGRYVIEGLGAMRRDVNGLFELAWDPAAGRHAAEKETEKAPEPVRREPEMPRPEPVAQPVRTEPARDAAVRDAAVREPVAGATAATAPPRATINDLYSAPARENIKENNRETPRETHRESAAPRRDAPVHGAANARREDHPHRDSAPRRETPVRQADRLYGQSPAAQRPVPQRPAGPRPPRPVNYRRGGRKKKTDIVMIVAIVAALVAIISMLYGVLVNENPASDMRPVNPAAEQVETVISE